MSMQPPRRIGLLALSVLFLLGLCPIMADTQNTERAKQFVAAHDAKFKSLDRKAGIAWWDANISGKDEDFTRKEEAQNVIDAALADAQKFAELKPLHEPPMKGELDRNILTRCIDLM